jgi:hypothetical protein
VGEDIDREIPQPFSAGVNVRASRIPGLMEMYRGTWASHGEPILHAMQRVSDLVFPQRELPVYMLNVGGLPQSKPVMIPFDQALTANRFLGMVTHELLHALFEGTRIPNVCFPGPKKTGQHVVIFAAMSRMFTMEIPNAALLAEERDFTDQSRDKEAWAVVDAAGADAILGRFQACARRHDVAIRAGP